MKKNPFLIMSNLISHTYEVDEIIDVTNYLMMKEHDENLAKEKKQVQAHDYTVNYTNRWTLDEETDFMKIMTSKIGQYNKTLTDIQKNILVDFVKKYNIDLFEDYVFYKSGENEIFKKEKNVLSNIIENESLFLSLGNFLLSEENTKEKFTQYIYNNNVLGTLINSGFTQSLSLLKYYQFDINHISQVENNTYPIFKLNNNTMYQYLNENFEINWNVKDHENKSILKYIKNSKENDLLIKNVLSHLKEDSSFDREVADKIINSIQTSSNKKDILKLIDSYNKDVREIVSENGDNLVMLCIKMKKYALANELYYQHKFKADHFNYDKKSALSYMLENKDTSSLAKTIAPKRKDLLNSFLQNENVFNHLAQEIVHSYLDININLNQKLSESLTPSFIIGKIESKYGEEQNSLIEALIKKEENKKQNYYTSNKNWEDENIVELLRIYSPVQESYYSIVLQQVKDLTKKEEDEDNTFIYNNALYALKTFNSNEYIFKRYQDALTAENTQNVIANIIESMTSIYHEADKHVSHYTSEVVYFLKWINKFDSERLNNSTIYMLTEIISKTDKELDYDNITKDLSIKIEKELLNREISQINKVSKKIKI